MVRGSAPRAAERVAQRGRVPRCSAECPEGNLTGWTPPTIRRLPYWSGIKKRGLRAANSVIAMATIEFVTIEVTDPAATNGFYKAAFGLDTQVRMRASEAPTTGFRGFTLSLIVSQPATVNGLIESALDAGATSLKPATKSLWGYGGVVQAPDGTIWTVASSSKKDTGPPTRQIDEIVLQLGVADVAESKR